MLAKVLVSCTLLVAAQAVYAPSNYGSNNAVLAGYSARLQPAVTVTVLPSSGYGAAPGYGGASQGYGGASQGYGGAAPGYGGGSQGYGGASQGYGASNGPVTIPYYTSNPSRSYNAGVDAEALQLASLVFALPSAGAPIPDTINVPQYASIGYTAPGLAAPSSNYGSPVNGASAAAAAANIGAQAPSKSNY